MEKIKLYVIETLENGTIRLQTQLTVMRKGIEANFILEKEKLYIWDGGGWALSNIDYELVYDKKQMKYQSLNQTKL